MNIHICDYGCGREGKYQLKNEKWSCSKNISQCPAIKKKMSESLKGKNKIPFYRIKFIAEKNNFKILTSENEYYFENLSKLKFECEEGHIFIMRLDSFLNNCKCPKCSWIETGKNRRISFEKIVEEAEEFGFKLLTSEYEYDNLFPSKLKFICLKNHIFKMRIDSFQSLHKCPKCSKRMKISFEEIIYEASQFGYKAIYDRNYKNTFSKVKFVCPDNHEFWMRWSNFHGGQRCPECAKKKNRIALIKKIENNVQIFPNYNPDACKLIDEYGKENNYNFQHAENGGEFHIKKLGYWVDGYDKKKNIVIEIDEASHFDTDGNLKEKDIKRQKEIMNFLGCEFIRLKI